MDKQDYINRGESHIYFKCCYGYSFVAHVILDNQCSLHYFIVRFIESYAVLLKALSMSKKVLSKSYFSVIDQLQVYDMFHKFLQISFRAYNHLTLKSWNTSTRNR